MIPSEIQVISALPLTKNGKLDRKALAAIPALKSKQQQDKQHIKAPTNDIEKYLLQVWQQLLDQQTIGIDDDFFAIGGHSLLATRVLGRIKQHFNLDIGFSQFFAHSRISSLSAIIKDEQDKQNQATDTAKQVVQQTSTKKNTLTL